MRCAASHLPLNGVNDRPDQHGWRWDTGPAASDRESLVTVEFTDLADERTEVVVTHERFPADHDTSPYRSGWDEGLEKLDAVTTKGEVDA